MENAFSRRAGHASISTLDVRTGRLQWGTAVHWREHHKIKYKLEASLRQVRPRRLGARPLLLIKKFGPPGTPARRILCDQHRRMVAYSVPN